MPDRISKKYRKLTRLRRGGPLKKPRLTGRQVGFSLLAITALGVVTMMWIFAISASVMPAFLRAAGGRYTTVLRSAAEAGLDWGVSQLNASIADGVVSSPLADSQWHAVPPEAIGNNSAVVSIRIIPKTPPTTSAVYSATSLQPAVNGNFWYVATAKASYAGMDKMIRVVLQPIFYSESGTNPYFTYALFGQKYVAFKGNSVVDGFNYSVYMGSGTWKPYGSSGNQDTFGGTVASNAYPPLTSIDLPVETPIWVNGDGLNGANIGGTVSITAGGASPLVKAGGNATMQNQILDNGTAQNGNVNLGGNARVLGRGGSRMFIDAASPFIVNTVNNPKGTGTEPLALNPTPAAPGVPPGETIITAKTTVVGSGNNAATTVQAPGANNVANLGTVNLTGSQRYYLPPGDYEASQISVANNAQIILTSGSGGYAPVRIFIIGNSCPAPIQLTGNAISNPSGIPGNLQFWYGGSQAITLSNNAAFYGTIYAPLAPIALGGNGHIYGAIAGYTIFVTGNAGIHFDEALASPTNPWATYSSPTLRRVQAITWQEPRSNDEVNRWLLP